MEGPELLVHCKLFLDQNKIEEALQVLKEERNEIAVKDVGWQLIEILCKQMTRMDGKGDFKTIEKCLQLLIQVCSPKEVLLGLGEHLSTQSCEKALEITIRLSKYTIVKLSRKQSIYLDNCCRHFVSKINFFLEKPVTDEETISDRSKWICSLVPVSLNFVHAILPYTARNKSSVLPSYLDEIYTDKSWESYEVSLCRNILLNFLLEIIRLCIVETNAYNDTTRKGLLESVAKTIFELFSFSGLIERLQYQNNQSKISNAIGVVALFYVIFVDGIIWCEIPLVYQHSFILTILQNFVEESLEVSSLHVTKVNLGLLSALLSKRKHSFYCVPTSRVKKMTTSLTNVMIWCEDEELRSQSQSVFLLFLKNMSVESKVPILLAIYEGSQHAGLQGYLIKHIISAVEEGLTHNCNANVDNGELALLFTKVIVGENNVLQESDRYIAGLNFVRYWLLRERKSRDSSSMWQKVEKLNKNISLIVKCLEFSKKEINEFLDNPSLSDTPSRDGSGHDLLTLPAGQVFSGLSGEEKRAISKKAFLTLDIMSSIIARIDEIISNGTN